MLHARACRRRRPRWPHAAALVAPIGLALACGDPDPPPPEPPRPVKMMTVGGGDAGVLEYPGEIRAAQRADVAFEVPGRIVAFPVQEAQRVAKGDLIARLDPRDYEAELEKADANLAKARADLDRYQKLYDEGVSPLIELERARRFHDVALADHKQAAKATEDAVLRAPFDGVVARKLVEDFANVQAKEPIAIVQDVSTLELRVAVPERDLARARPNDDLGEISSRIQPHVVVSALPGRVFPARIVELTTQADPTTRTYTATLAFESPEDANVMPGMTAKAVLPEAAATEAVRVPASAVLADEAGAPFVWVVDPETLAVSQRSVELGGLSAGWVEIASGLSPGDTIAISGVHQLREGMVVRRFDS